MTDCVREDHPDEEAEKAKHARTRLRCYNGSDLGAMYALDVACFERPFRFSLRAMRGFAEADNAKVFVAERNELLVAFAILHIEEADDRGAVGYVVTLDVAAEHRRSGVAGALMHSAEEFALHEGCAGMALHVFTGNEVAMRFYAHAGFRRLHRDEGFYGQGLDAWFCYKALSFAKL